MTFHTEIWKGVVDGPGLYLGVPEDRYHMDPAPEPSLSASVAKIAYNKSLSKARAAHPRLRDPDFPEDDDDEADRSPPWYVDVGSAVHSLSLGAGAPVAQVASARDWKKKEAQEIRKQLRADGYIPLLTKHWDLAHRMSTKLRPRLVDLMGKDFAAEAMAVSQHSEFGWWMRSLIDASSPDLRVICDVKTTSLDMSPRQAGRTINRNDNFFQSSFYMKNLDQLDPAGMGRRKFYFIFQETQYPHEIALVYPDEAAKSAADVEVERAMRLWDSAMKTGVWRGYPEEPVPVAPENWMLREIMERDDEL